MTFRLAILNTHPIQYFAPLYRRLNQTAAIEVTAFYCSRQGLDSYHDPGFGQTVKWDTPLLEGYEAHFLPNWRNKKTVSGFFSLVNPAIIGELRRGQFDALLVNGHNYVSLLLGIAAANLFRIPVMMRGETHLLLERQGLKKRLRRPVMTTFYKFCRICLPIGSLNADFYRHHGVSDDRLFLVPYTVNNDHFIERSAAAHQDPAAQKQRLGLPIDKPLILYASKLTARKRPHDLLTAYQRLRREGHTAALVIVGSGEEEEALKGAVATAGIPDVYFMGFQNQQALPTFFALADMFVLPSQNEPWGLIVNEAMCGATPIITTSEVGSAADLVIPGETGFTYPAGNVEALTTHLRTLIQDPTLTQQMGQQALAHIQTWNYERCVKGIIAALNKLYPDRAYSNSNSSSNPKPTA